MANVETARNHGMDLGVPRKVLYGISTSDSLSYDDLHLFPEMRSLPLILVRKKAV